MQNGEPGAAVSAYGPTEEFAYHTDMQLDARAPLQYSVGRYRLTELNNSSWLNVAVTYRA